MKVIVEEGSKSIVKLFGLKIKWKDKPICESSDAQYRGRSQVRTHLLETYYQKS